MPWDIRGRENNCLWKAENTPSRFLPEHLNFWKRFLFLFKAQSEKLLEKLKISVKEEGEKSDPAFPSFRAKGSEPTQAQGPVFDSHLCTQGRKGDPGLGLSEPKMHKDQGERNPGAHRGPTAAESRKWS